MSVKIVPYDPKYKEDYIAITRHWVEKYFVMEEGDFKALNNVEEHVLAPGGMIFLAIDEATEEVLGCCGIGCIHSTDENGKKTTAFELIKMGVKEHTQGRGIGKKLCIACLEYAKSINAPTVFLEGNRILEASIALYTKIGFKEIPLTNSHYSRGNICMEFDFSTTPIPSSTNEKNRILE